jgi:hypothetical protein
VWRKRLPRKGVQLSYSTRFNANPKLLRLFSRLGVALRVATKSEISLVKETTSHTSTVLDDCAILTKPASFYRSLLLDCQCSKLGTASITVDGVDELDRIHFQMQSICIRRNQALPHLRFILKLDDITTDDWKISFINLHTRARELAHGVTGFALELLREQTEVPYKDPILLDALMNLIVFGKSENLLPLPEVHLSSSKATAGELGEDVFDAIRHLSQLCSSVSVDISQVLVANAAALCARIIGVKNSEGSRIHYYIDDGCYGSLSNYSKDGIPLPLRNNTAERVSTVPFEKYQTGCPTTVWGPTCTSSPLFLQLYRPNLSSHFLTRLTFNIYLKTFSRRWSRQSLF